MHMMTSQILKFIDFTKNHENLDIENKTLFFLQIKKITNYILRATLLQNKSFAVEVTFKFTVDTTQIFTFGICYLKLSTFNSFMAEVPTI